MIISIDSTRVCIDPHPETGLAIERRTQTAELTATRNPDHRFNAPNDQFWLQVRIPLTAEEHAAIVNRLGGPR